MSLDDIERALEAPDPGARLAAWLELSEAEQRVAARLAVHRRRMAEMLKRREEDEE